VGRLSLQLPFLPSSGGRKEMLFGGYALSQF